MNFFLASDLHLEHIKRYEYPFSVPDVDFVILAGDIATGFPGVDWAKSLEVPVFYVPGNHEFYSRRIVRQLEKLRERVKGSNVKILYNDTDYVNNVRIIGSTLWTDFCLHGLNKQDEYMALAKRVMTDYKKIKWDIKVKWNPFLALTEHQKAVSYIQQQLAQKHNGPTIVVTHHAPSLQSALSEEETHRPLYASNLESLIEEYQPEYWFHGHIHSSVDYTIGQTRVKSNPYGYHGYKVNTLYDPTLIMET